MAMERRKYSFNPTKSGLCFLAVVWLGTFGCQSEQEPMKVPEGAVAGDLFMEPCSHERNGEQLKADCGVLVVPENRSDHSSRLIALPVKRIYGSGSNPVPIFQLNGGPGQSNMNVWPDGVRDLVAVGYRGMDGTVKLSCPEIGEAFAEAPGGLLSRESLSNITKAYSACAQNLKERDIDIDGYTVSEVIADMEAARVGLGYDRVDLISGSYGTRVAMIYAWMHPQSIHRAVLVGVNTPGRCIWDPKVTDAQIQNLARLYAQEKGLSPEDVIEDLRRVAQNMPGQWLFLEVDPGYVKSVTFNLLYDVGNAGAVFDAGLAAADGDWSGLALMTLAAKFIFPSAVNWGENVAKTMSIDYAEYDHGRDYFSEYDPPNSILGAPMSMMGWAARAGWPSNLISEEFLQVQPSDVEMLLIGGNVDLASPVENARDDLLPHLSRGQQVIISDCGHVGDVWNLQPDATAHLVSTFYETGEVDDSRFTHLPITFDVSWGFPLMAKIGVAMIVLIVLGLAFLIFFVGRRVRRAVNRD